MKGGTEHEAWTPFVPILQSVFSPRRLGWIRYKADETTERKEGKNDVSLKDERIEGGAEGGRPSQQPQCTQPSSERRK